MLNAILMILKLIIIYLEEKKFNFKKATQVSDFPSSLRDISISINNENIIEDVISSVFKLNSRI